MSEKGAEMQTGDIDLKFSLGKDFERAEIAPLGNAVGHLSIGDKFRLIIPWYIAQDRKAKALEYFLNGEAQGIFKIHSWEAAERPSLAKRVGFWWKNKSKFPFKRVLTLLAMISLLSSANVWAHEPHPCSLIRVLDGDTFECRATIEPFFKLSKDVMIRVGGVDCPEVRGAEKPYGLKAKEYAIRVLTETKSITISNLQKDKFGRVVATVNLDYGTLNQKLISSGFCQPYGQ